MIKETGRERINAKFFGFRVVEKITFSLANPLNGRFQMHGTALFKYGPFGPGGNGLGADSFSLSSATMMTLTVCLPFALPA